ncbi:hypothetical protein Trydic_g17964 [Trypoxylus dichotomus]
MRWESTVATLQYSTLRLVYSAAEYCPPVWLNSQHRELRCPMGIITGCTKIIPMHLLSVFSYIPPPKLRRQDDLNKAGDWCGTGPSPPRWVVILIYLVSQLVITCSAASGKPLIGFEQSTAYVEAYSINGTKSRTPCAIAVESTKPLNILFNIARCQHTLAIELTYNLTIDI